MNLAACMVRRVLPVVGAELGRWRARAARCPDPLLRAQALLSMEHKRFHCQGGSALALLAGPKWRGAVSFVVALQTISDYLDNLSDRAGQVVPSAMRRLHLAMLDAVDPPRSLPHGRDQAYYYALYPVWDDGGYLGELVRECGRLVEELGIPLPVRQSGRRLVSLYRDFQVCKHSPAAERTARLRAWATRRLAPAPAGSDCAVPRLGARSAELVWPEVGAAAGSTLAVFASYAAAAAGRGDVSQILDAYFPWIGGMHILLDYLIDTREDRSHGDLNLVACYGDAEEAYRRLVFFVRRARDAANGLEEPGFHRSVVAGLLGVYLSDPKVAALGLQAVASALLRACGREALALHSVCRGLRRSRLV
jgi:tetraprenyl-beta-curcumene synthase